MGWRAALAAVVIALIAPAAARAATVRVVWLPCGHHHGECPSELRYTAAAGEANDVTLRIDGGAGNDTLAGRPGDDVLSGGSGTDDPHGGDPGNWEPGGSDRLACGADRDRANQVRARDRVADDCEVVDGGWAVFDMLLPPASLEAPLLRVRSYICAEPEPCRIRVTVRSRGRVLGRARARVPGVERRLPLRLSARGRRILRRERRLPVTIAFRGPFERTDWRVVLRAPSSAQ